MPERIPSRNIQQIKMRTQQYNDPSPSMTTIKIPNRNIRPPKK